MDPDAPGAFRFGETGKLARIFSEAGAVAVHERDLNFRIEAPISRDQFWEMRAGTSGTLREKLANLGTEQVQLIASEMKEAVREFFPNDQMSFPAQMILVTGRKS
jgi:FAD/FMN-containing dehydrogenase